jgi:hypothetical protein
MKSHLFFLGMALALSSAAPASAQTPASWAQPVNVTTTDGTLTKSGGCDLCPDSGAHSAAILTGNGFVEFIPAAGHRITAGLNTNLSASTHWSMDYSFSIWPNGAFEIRERGVYRGEGSFIAGDRFRVSIDGDHVVYSVNDAAVYTSTVAPVFPMALDVTLSSRGASLYHSTVVALPTPTTWEAPVNVTASTGALTKSSGCDGCSDSGAHSAMSLSGEGYAEFVAPAGHRITAGLSADLTASTSVMTMNYAFSLWPNGAWEIRELGIYKKE